MTRALPTALESSSQDWNNKKYEHCSLLKQWIQYGDVIDYVSYQFYMDRVQYPAFYLEAFRQRAGQSDVAKFLPSYEINRRGTQGDVFFDALCLIESKGFYVNGIMIYIDV